jgi:SAM-dependent methyltransferase
MSFDVAAEAYDRFMGRYSIPLAEEFLATAGAPARGAALDVGCGPGALTGALVARYGAPAVAAIDPTPAFVAAARSRYPGADVREADAEALPFPDGAFDATLAELVVHFMADPAAGMGEMVRVTRSGGVVAACVWDFSGGRAPQSLFFEALGMVVDGVDDESDRVGARRGDLATLLTDAGCVDVVETELSVTVRYAGFDEWWDPYTLRVSPAGVQLARLSDEQRAEVRAGCAERLPAGPFEITAMAWSARGLAPAR